MNRVSLDSPLPGGNNLHDLIGDRGPLKSSWMMRERFPAPERSTIKFFAVDVDGETVCTAPTQDLAAEVAREHGGDVRHVRLTEADMQLEERLR